MLFKSYMNVVSLKMSGIFHLMFLNYGWPCTTVTMESETPGEGATVLLTHLLSKPACFLMMASGGQRCSSILGRKPCFPTQIVTDGETMAEVIK